MLVVAFGVAKMRRSTASRRASLSVIFGMAHIFDPRQIAKCYDLLAKANTAFYRSRNSNTVPEFQSHWRSFLSETGNLIHAIEAGAKFTPQAKQWYYSKIMREMRADPLLRYMYQARNSEIHGSKPVSYTPWGLPFGFRDTETGEIEWISDEYSFQKERKRTIVIGAPPVGPALKAVTDDRFKEVFAPPAQHLGKSIEGSTFEVGALFLAYLEALVKKADSLA